jgi:hypothetical protein
MLCEVISVWARLDHVMPFSILLGQVRPFYSKLNKVMPD